MRTKNILADEQREREIIDDWQRVMHGDAIDLNRCVDVTANHGAYAANANNIGSCPRKQLNRWRARQSAVQFYA